MAREIRKYFDIKDNGSTIHQSLRDVAKAVLVVGIYSLIFLYCKTKERCKINNQSSTTKFRK